MNEILKQKSNTWGGARPNAGRPLVRKQQTRKKNSEEEIKQVLRSANKLINAQMMSSRSSNVICYRKQKEERIKTQTNYRPNDYWKIFNGELDNEPDEYYFITTERPDNRALDSLLDRIFGKAVSNLDITSDGKSLVVNIDKDIAEKNNVKNEP